MFKKRGRISSLSSSLSNVVGGIFDYILSKLVAPVESKDIWYRYLSSTREKRGLLRWTKVLEVGSRLHNTVLPILLNF